MTEDEARYNHEDDCSDCDDEDGTEWPDQPRSEECLQAPVQRSSGGIQLLSDVDEEDKTQRNSEECVETAEDATHWSHRNHVSIAYICNDDIRKRTKTLDASSI